MAIPTHPALICGGAAGRPLLQEPGIILHGSAWAETAIPTVKVGADYAAAVRGEVNRHLDQISFWLP
jgi:hypothetical protein